MLIKITDHVGRAQNLQIPHRGYVLENADPRSLGRIKVWIPELIESQEVSNLPWIYPKFQIGSVNIPEIGDTVEVCFPYEDIYAGFYTGQWIDETNKSATFTENYPNTYGFEDSQNTRMVINKTQGTAEFTHKTGSGISFAADGTIVVRSPQQVRFESPDGTNSYSFNMESGELNLTPREAHVLSGKEARVETSVLKESVGSKTQEVSGSKTVTVAGTNVTKVGGNNSTSIIGSDSKVCSGMASKTIAGKYSKVIGAGEDVKIATIGRTTKIAAGVDATTIAAGSKSTDILVGNYSVSVKAGTITIQTLVGTAKFGTALGTISMDPTGSVTVQAATAVSIKSALSVSIDATAAVQATSGASIDLKAGAQCSLAAPLVLLGAGTGAVLTQITMPVVDNITGVPSMGVPTVMAG